jgi:hypothetical protein
MHQAACIRSRPRIHTTVVTLATAQWLQGATKRASAAHAWRAREQNSGRGACTDMKWLRKEVKSADTCIDKKTCLFNFVGDVN